MKKGFTINASEDSGRVGGSFTINELIDVLSFLKDNYFFECVSLPEETKLMKNFEKEDEEEEDEVCGLITANIVLRKEKISLLQEIESQSKAIDGYLKNVKELRGLLKRIIESNGEKDVMAETDQIQIGEKN